MHGHAYDIVTSQPVPGATMRLENEYFSASVHTDLNDYYLVEVPGGFLERLTVIADGYKPISDSDDFEISPSDELTLRNFDLKPKVKGDANQDDHVTVNKGFREKS